MTNQQLYLAIGIPILFNSSILFFLFNLLNGRLNEINGDFKKLDGKVDATRLELVGRIDLLDGKVDANRLELVSRIDRLDRKVDANRLELASRIDRVADPTATFYRELDKYEIAIGKLQSN